MNGDDLIKADADTTASVKRGAFWATVATVLAGAGVAWLWLFHSTP